MAEQFSIEKMLVISTGNLPRDVCQALENPNFVVAPSFKREEGFLMYKAQVGNFPAWGKESFERIYGVMIAKDIEWLLIDRDAALVDWLPQYIW